MHILEVNFSWMTVNIFLALIAALFGFAAHKVKNPAAKYILWLFWLLFLPNTIYLFTDLLNLMRQWDKVDFFQQLVLIFQYSILQIFGVTTYILGLYPFEKALKRSKYIGKNNVNYLIIVLNFIVAFGITLGRIERINSWDVLKNPASVLYASIHILSSFELIFLTILFAIFANTFYFLCRKPVIVYFKKQLNIR